MTIPIEVASGRAIAKRPHMNMMTPQTIDQPVAVVFSLTVVSEFIFVIQIALRPLKLTRRKSAAAGEDKLPCGRTGFSHIKTGQYAGPAGSCVDSLVHTGYLGNVPRSKRERAYNFNNQGTSDGCAGYGTTVSVRSFPSSPPS